MDEISDGFIKPKGASRARLRFGPLTAGLIALGAADPASAADPHGANPDNRAAHIATSSAAASEIARGEAPARKYGLSPYFQFAIDKDADEFWRALRHGIYKEYELADDIFLYAAKKSSGGFWETLFASGVFRERLMHGVFIEAALHGVDGVEYFLNHDRFAEEERAGGFGLEKNFREQLIIRAAEIDPVVATNFLRLYYERGQGRRQYPHADLILEGTRAWRDANLLSSAERSPDNGPYKKMVVVLNNLFVLPEKRDDMLKGLDSATIYRIATSAPDDIFTSSYKKALAPLMKNSVREEGLWNYLQTVDAEKANAGAFFQLAARFGELPSFLQRASPEDVRESGAYLAAALASTSSTSDAVTLLEFLLAARDNGKFEDALRALEKVLIEGYHASDSTDRRLHSALGVVGSVYAGANKGPLSRPEEFAMLQKSYPAPDFARLDARDLFDEPTGSGVMRHRQRWYFADSLDGKATFAYEIEKFKKEGGWKIEEHRAQGYVVVRKKHKNRMATIYMNIPDAVGVSAGDIALDKHLRGMRVHALALRGHSFETSAILARMRASGMVNPSIAIVGSCGYKEIDEALDLSETPGRPALIFSKGSADKMNNHKILSGLIEELLQRGGVSFSESWPRWGIAPEYVPPHENYSAAVISLLKR